MFRTAQQQGVWAALRQLWERARTYQRFTLQFKVLLLVPLVLWLLLFQLAAAIPNSKKPPVDTTTLPKLESWILFGYSMQRWPGSLFPHTDAWDTFRDVLALSAAFVYLIHFGLVWIFVLGLWLYYRHRSSVDRKVYLHPWNFLWVFGWVNLLAVCTQLAWPTAPPWYVEQYGSYAPVNYNVSGEPAGLANVDNILEIPLFELLYGRSPIVFGSFPSLHAAWPLTIAMFGPTRGYRTAGALYTGWVWWAAVYLNHHYVVDILGGALFVVVLYFLGIFGIRILIRALPERHVLSGGAYNLVETLPLTAPPVTSPGGARSTRHQHHLSTGGMFPGGLLGVSVNGTGSAGSMIEMRALIPKADAQTNAQGPAASLSSSSGSVGSGGGGGRKKGRAYQKGLGGILRRIRSRDNLESSGHNSDEEAEDDLPRSRSSMEDQESTGSQGSLGSGQRWSGGQPSVSLGVAGGGGHRPRHSTGSVLELRDAPLAQDSVVADESGTAGGGGLRNSKVTHRRKQSYGWNMESSGESDDEENTVMRRIGSVPHSMHLPASVAGGAGLSSLTTLLPLPRPHEVGALSSSSDSNASQ
jgi:membrane-associated phospholipid phosphatase